MAATSTPSGRERVDPVISLALAAEQLGERGLAGRIPGASLPIWRDVVIERWLSGGDQRADIMGALTDPTRLDAGGLPWASAPVIADWLRPDDPLPSSVLWLEWDRPSSSSAAELARPLMSVCVSDTVLRATAQRRVPTEPRERTRLIDRTLALFDERQARAPLTDLRERLPAGAELTHLAGLRPRGREGVRLVAWMTAARVEAWLRACSWPGPFDSVRPLLTVSAAPFRNIGVQLELCDGELGPYLGIETPEYFARPSSIQFRSWVEVLRSLGATVEDATLAEHVATLRPTPREPWPGPDRLYLKAAYDGRWHAKSYVASG